jgi:aminocarboxymuconate-semialdehyde decarboxylase
MVMPTRREFLIVLGGAAAGALLGTPGFAQPRREVFVGGKRAFVVDIHAHGVFPEVAEIVRGTPLEDVAETDEEEALTPERVAIMDRRGIDLQVLSVNDFWWYAADMDLARRIVDTHDRGLQRFVARFPDRFVALSSPALQFPELAAQQLERAVRELGHRGASVLGHCNGESLSSPRFDPFWRKAEQLGVPVFMHPDEARNVAREGAFDGRGDLGNIIGNPLESTVFLSRMIFDGTLDRFPKLQIAVAHGGGYLASYLGRTEVACAVREDANCANQLLPSEYLRRQIYVDSLVFSEQGIVHLVAEMGGADRVVYGSDLPFNWPETIDLIVGSKRLSDKEKLAILGGNLVRLLRLRKGRESSSADG